MKRNKMMAVLFAMVGILALVITVFVILLGTRVKREYTIEAGQELNLESFRRYSWDKGGFEWVEQPDTSTVGKKTGKIKVFPVTYKVTVIVTGAPVPTQPVAGNTQTPAIENTQTPLPDTEAPVVTTQKVTIYAGNNAETVAPQQFIADVQEESSYTVEFLSEPDDTVYGNQTLRLVVTDAAGNSTEVEEQLCILNLKESLFLELGTEFPAAEEFLYAPGSEISFLTDISTISVMMEGTHEIVFLVDGVEAVAVVQIKDTTAPELVLIPAETWLNKPLEVNSFIDFEASADNSDAFDTAYVAEPDWTLEGEQKVQLVATDIYGNSVTEETTLNIKRDEKAPVVTVTDIDVKVGGTVSYKKAVSYYDDIDTKDEMKLSIERSSVNLKEVGTYEVTYTVTDCSGNSTSVVGKINVLEEAPKWEDEEVIHAKAQEVLDSILEEGMTDREKAKAIYKWLKNNIGYISHSEKGNYTRGAYEGLFKKQGDCFVYAATAKELLTLAGIQNIDIVKATTNPSHYWNLVYIEDGWYHFDATPRKDKSEFFLLTDAELEAYSSAHNNTHIFDRSLYPEIK